VSARGLARLLAAYVAVLALACIFVRARFALDAGAPIATVASRWGGSTVLAREVTAGAERPQLQGAALEIAVAEGPLPTHPVLFALSLVAGRDGVRAELGGRSAWVTPDDLVAAQAYDRGVDVKAIGLTFGVRADVVVALLAERLGAGTTARNVLESATLRRVRFERPAPALGPSDVTPERVRDSIVRAARHLARGVSFDGRFRYLVDAPTNRSLPGYDWPRHAGATYFLAQAAALTGDAELAAACLRAAGHLRDRATVDCAGAACIGSDDDVDLGSSALALLAYAEIARTHLDDAYRAQVERLARFLREQELPDGSFATFFTRSTKTRVVLNVPYYPGEATLALARAARVTGSDADQRAAELGLAHLVGAAWSFFGDRYYFAEEHWTCQALEDLWDRAPNPRALDFCLGWQRFNRAVQLGPGESPFDGDGAYQLGPIATPRLTPAASRSEAGIATLVVAERARPGDPEARVLEAQLRRSLALLLRHQLVAERAHILADPRAVEGAFPGSAVDWQLRIDYAQHAGSALVRWYERAAAQARVAPNL
jgi:hypothetical protein